MAADELKKNIFQILQMVHLGLQAFSVTEPTSGSDTLSIKTSAKKNWR